MTPREIILAQLGHRQTDPVPYTLAFDQDVLDRLDAHYGGEAWRERIVPYIARPGGVTGAFAESIDEGHYRDIFGAVWRRDCFPPVVVEPALKAPSFEGYDFPSTEAFVSTEAVANSAQRARETTDSFTIVNITPCLWQTWYVRGFQETMMDSIAEPAFYTDLLDRMTEMCLGVIAACADVPADAIMMGDDWGIQKGVMLGPDRWREYFKPRYARIFQAIHDQGKRAILHCCGSVAEIMGDIVEIGLDVLESVQPEAAGMNPYQLKAQWGDRITFWGCLGSQSTIPFGTPDEIRQEIRKLRAEMAKGGGFILAPAKPLRPETPTENAIAIVEEFLALSPA